MPDPRLMTKAEIDTLDWKVSASQLTTYDPSLGGCPRKLVYKYVLGYPDPPGQGALLGSECHKIWEEYFGYGTPPDKSTRPGKIVDAGIHLYPSYGDVDFRVERREVILIDDMPYRVAIDLMWPQANTYWINDHKTSSNPRRYGLTDEKVTKDPQALLYTLTGYLCNPGMREVKSRWTYHKTRGAVDPFVFYFQLGYDEILDLVGETIKPRAEEILWIIRNKPKVEDMPANLDACDNFGGCPYAEFCPVDPQDRVKQIMKSTIRQKRSTR